MLGRVLRDVGRLHARRPPTSWGLSARRLPSKLAARGFSIKEGRGKNEESKNDLSEEGLKQKLNELKETLEREKKEAIEREKETWTQKLTELTATLELEKETREREKEASEAMVNKLTLEMENRKKEQEESEKKKQEESERKKKKEAFWEGLFSDAAKNLLTGAVASVAAAGFAAFIFFTAVPFDKRRAEFLFGSCAVPELPEDDAEVYVEREGAEARILAFVSGKVTAYQVICGPRGIGKSTAVVKALANRPRVIYLKLDGKNITTIDDAIHAAFEDQFLFSRFLFRLGNPFNLARALAFYKGVPDDEKPVVVLDIVANASADTIKSQSQKLKEIVTWDKVCHGILVLSDAKSAGNLNDDKGRQRFVWFDVFSEEEFQKFFDNLGVLAPDGDAEAAALRRKIIDEIGPTPQDIVDTAADAKTAEKTAVEAARSSGVTEAECVAAGRAAVRKVFEQWCEKKQKEASIEVVNLLTRAKFKYDFQRLVPDLVENYPAGVSPKGHVSAKEASTDINDYHAIAYNSEAQVYQFFSAAHYHAARRWLEEEAEAKAKAEAEAKAKSEASRRWFR